MHELIKATVFFLLLIYLAGSVIYALFFATPVDMPIPDDQQAYEEYYFIR